MYKRIKVCCLLLARFLGFFRLARRITNKKLRILCFHGISQSDEHLFRPMFITEETFLARLSFLHKEEYPVAHLRRLRFRVGMTRMHAILVLVCDKFDAGERTPFSKVISLVCSESSPPIVGGGPFIRLDGDVGFQYGRESDLEEALP